MEKAELFLTTLKIKGTLCFFLGSRPESVSINHGCSHITMFQKFLDRPDMALILLIWKPHFLEVIRINAWNSFSEGESDE